MILDKRLVVVVPAGRRRYLEVQAAHVLACPEVDEYRLWLNTKDAEDVAWMRKLRDEHAGRVTIEEPRWDVKGNQSIHRFFGGCCDPDCVYVRLDDDVVWVGDLAIPRLARARLENPNPPVYYGHVLNNAITSHLHQRAGRLTTQYGNCDYNCLCKVGWKNSEFALDLHRRFLANPHARQWELPDWVFLNYERFSINVLAFTGADFKEFNGVVGGDEECWLSQDHPKRLQRPNRMAGDAMFVHYAFHTQRGLLDSHPDILAGYRKLAGLS